MQKIILIGSMGSGKSTIGKLLASRLCMPFVDMDEVIVKRAGKSIPGIFEADGESVFRALEGEVLETLTSNAESKVIATGGGAVLNASNRKRMKCGSVVWLDAPPEVLAKRTASDSNRPLLKGVDPLQKAEELDRQRRPLYEVCADFKVDTSVMSANEAVEEIAGFLSECADE